MGAVHRSPWRRFALVVWSGLAAWFGLAMLGGCESRSDRFSRETALQYAALPSLRSSPVRELRDEYSRLLAEDATPVLLDRRQRRASSPTDRLGKEPPSPLLDEKQQREFGKFAVEVRSWLNERPDPAEGSPLSDRSAPRLEPRHQEFCRQFQQQIATGAFDPRVPISHGLLADVAHLDQAAIGCTLLTLTAWEQFQRTDEPASLTTLHDLFAAASRLAEQPHPVPRFNAVEVREEILAAVRRMTASGRCSANFLATLRRELKSQLDAWPADALVWLGDRAVGSHAYEMIREKYLFSLLSLEEAAAWKKEFTPGQFHEFVTTNLDQDQAFYLAAMRSLIAACPRGHAERLAAVEAAEQQIAAWQGTTLYPLIADRLLLKPLRSGLRQQALDRARCEAWHLAVALALDPADPLAANPPTNPLTERPFIVDRNDQRVIIDRIDDQGQEPPITVPLRSPHATQSPTLHTGGESTPH